MSTATKTSGPPSTGRTKESNTTPSAVTVATGTSPESVALSKFLAEKKKQSGLPSSSSPTASVVSTAPPPKADVKPAAPPATAATEPSSAANSTQGTVVGSTDGGQTTQKQSSTPTDVSPKTVADSLRGFANVVCDMNSKALADDPDSTRSIIDSTAKIWRWVGGDTSQASTNTSVTSTAPTATSTEPSTTSTAPLAPAAADTPPPSLPDPLTGETWTTMPVTVAISPDQPDRSGGGSAGKGAPG